MAFITNSPQAPREIPATNSAKALLAAVREGSNYKTLRVVIGSTALFLDIALLGGFAVAALNPKSDSFQLLVAGVGVVVGIALVTAAQQAVTVVIDIADTLLAQETRQREL